MENAGQWRDFRQISHDWLGIDFAKPSQGRWLFKQLFFAGNGAAYLEKNDGKFTDWADLDKPSVTVAATLGTTQEKQVKAFFPNAKHKIVEAPARDFQEVLAGRADAHITSNVEAYKLVAKYPEMMIVPVRAPKAPTPIAMLLPQADQVWINYVNTWIALKTERGFFADLGRKWQLSN